MQSDQLPSKYSFVRTARLALLWRPDLVWVHAVSDLLIAPAYFSIPLALMDFVRRRRDLQFKWIFDVRGIYYRLGADPCW